MYRVGIVGSNLYGRIYARAFAANPEVELVGLVPAEGDHELELARQLGINQFGLVDQLIAKTRPNAICICSGTVDHLKHTLAAAHAGAHIICDRPIAMTIGEAYQMITAASDAGVVLMVGHVLRFWPEYVRAKEILTKEGLGRIRSVTTSRVSGTLSEPWQRRLLDPALGFGGLEALIHDFDYLDWLLGEPASLYAHGIKADNGGWGQMQCLVDYQGGGQAQAESSYLVPLAFPLAMYLRVLAEEGTLVFEFQGALSSRGESTRRLVLTREGQPPELVQVPEQDAYVSLTSHFIQCIEMGIKPELGTAEQAVRALSMLLTAVQSASLGEKVAPASAGI